MSLSKKLKLALKSSPSTKPLIKYLESLDSSVSNAESILENVTDSGDVYDDTDLKSKIGYDDIPNDTNLQAEINAITIPSDVSDLTDNQNTAFTPKSHTHTESDISNLGDYIEKSNTTGLVKNDGTIDTNNYLTTHQSISSKLDISQTSYKGKNVVVDSVSGDISFEDKPTIPTDISDLTDTTDIIPTDISDLTDTNGTIPVDVSDLTDTNNTTFTPKSHTHTISNISDATTSTITITYTDDTTATLTFVVQNSS